MPWAIQMYESSSKYPNNILTGEVIELGNFDRCMSVSSKDLGIYGAYVLVNLRFHSVNSKLSNPLDFDNIFLNKPKKNKLTVGPNSMLWAVCFPDSCTGEDVRQSIEHKIIPTFQPQNITVDVVIPPPFYTSKSTTLKYSPGILLTYGVIIGCVVLAIIGTLYERFTDQSKSENNGLFKKFLCSYSIISNLKNLVEDPKDTDYNIINGLKFMGIIQMICFHRLVLDLGAPSFNPEFFDNMYGSFWSGALKTQIPVEIYFVVSGFLSYIYVNNYLRRRNSFNFLKILAYRFLRIFPTYIIVILIFAFIFPYMGNGPLWQSIVYSEAEFCRKNWWTNLLFINNYVNSYEMCMFHSWYLACDMQFYILGTLLTYIIYKWKKVGMSIVGIIFVLSIYLPAKFIYENNQLSFIPVFRSEVKDVRLSEYFHSVYIRSEFRFSTYLIGMITAYIYLHIKQTKFKFSLKSRFTGCIISFSIMYICMAVTGFFYLPNISYDSWNHVLCFTLQRNIYALTISYIIILGLLSDLGIVTSFFKSKICTVISRLSYVAYLVHLIVVLQSIAQIRQPQYENVWTLVGNVNFDFTTTLVYTLFINIIIEAPCRKIINHVLSSLEYKKTKLNTHANRNKYIFKENIQSL